MFDFNFQCSRCRVMIILKMSNLLYEQEKAESNNTKVNKLKCAVFNVKWCLFFLWVIICNEQMAHASTTLMDSPGYPLKLPICEPDFSIQQCVSKKKRVRLRPVDYSRALNGRALIISTGQEIFGLPGTVIPIINIVNGSKRIRISNIETVRIEFLPGKYEFSENNIKNVKGDVVGIDVKMVSNRFVRILGRLNFQNKFDGYLRDNLFVGCHAHGSFPAITLIGNKKYSSSGNAFLWYSFQTPAGSATKILEQDDISFAGVAAEAWNYLFRDRSWSPLIDVRQTGKLNIIGAGIGGEHSPFPTPFLTSDARENVLINVFGTSPKFNDKNISPKSPWTKGDLNKIIINNPRKFSWIYPISKNFQVDYGVVHSGDKIYFDKYSSFRLPMVLSSIPKINSNVQYEKISRINRIDSSRIIQDAIDKSPSGIIFLPKGVFYIGSPIILRGKQGIVGSGSNQTRLISLNNSDIIQPAPGDDGRSSFILSNLSLESGRIGINSSSKLFGNFILQEIFLADVSIKGMSDAGFLVDGIQGMDNNFIDHVDFIENNIGFKQNRSQIYGGNQAAGLNYVDKVIFYKSRFIRNKIGVSLLAGRQDNQNAWINNLFIDNINPIILNNNDTALIFGSTFFRNKYEIINSYDSRSESTSPLTIISSIFDMTGGNNKIVQGRFSGVNIIYRDNLYFRRFSYVDPDCFLADDSDRLSLSQSICDAASLTSQPLSENSNGTR